MLYDLINILYVNIYYMYINKTNWSNVMKTCGGVVRAISSNVKSCFEKVKTLLFNIQTKSHWGMMIL